MKNTNWGAVKLRSFQVNGGPVFLVGSNGRKIWYSLVMPPHWLRCKGKGEKKCENQLLIWWQHCRAHRASRDMHSRVKLAPAEKWAEHEECLTIKHKRQEENSWSKQTAKMEETENGWTDFPTSKKKRHWWYLTVPVEGTPQLSSWMTKRPWQRKWAVICRISVLFLIKRG